MSKLNLATLCLMFALMVVAVISAPTFEAKFLADHLTAGSSALIQFKIGGFDLSRSFRATSTLTTAQDDMSPKPQLWNFKSSPTSFIENISGYVAQSCWDETTKQVVATVSVTSTAISISGNSLYNQMVKQQTTPENTVWTINCAVAADNTVTPVALGLKATGSDFSNAPVESSIVDLAIPTKGWVTPIIEFKKATLKQQSDDAFSSTEVDIEFTTDTAGVYNFNLANGPLPSVVNDNDGTWADLWCTSGSNKEFARVVYRDLSSPITIFITQSSSKDSIKCKFVFSNSSTTTFVRSERVVAQLSHVGITVSRGLDYKLTPGALSASANGFSFSISSTPLEYTSTPINNNSTIEFKFSKSVDLSSLQLEEGSDETSYQSNINCYSPGEGLRATSFVNKDKRTIVLKDVLLDNFTGLDCEFEFTQSPFHHQDKVTMGSVTVLIDGKPLASRFSPGNDAPIYLQTVGEFNQSLGSHEEIEAADEQSVTVIDTFVFKDEYSQYHTVMSNPVFLVKWYGDRPFTMEEYKDQVTCEATSPTNTQYQPLKLKFDEKQFIWSAEMKSLVKIESYQISIRCTRVIPKVYLYGINVTPSTDLDVMMIDLIANTRFFKSGYTYNSFSRGKALSSYTGPLPKTSVAAYCAETSFSVPAFNEVNYSAAKTSFETQLGEYMKTISTGWTPSATPYTTVITNQLRSTSYLSFTKSIEIAEPSLKLSNNLKSYEYETAFDHYDNYNAASAQNTARQSISDGTRSYRSCFNVEKGSTVASGETQPQFGTDAVDNFFKPSLATVYGTSPVSTYSFSDDNSFNSPITGCGVENGYFLVNSAGYDFEAAGYDNLKSLDTGYISCQLGETCKRSYDCDSGACKGGVCVEMPTYDPAYIAISRSTKALDKDYFNSSSIISLFGVVVAVVVAVLC